MIKKAFTLIFRKLRVGEAQNYKAPVLVSIAYFFLYSTHASFFSASLAIGCSIATGIGVSGLGYFINDLTDRTADRAAGIPNGTEGLSIGQVLLVSLFFFSAFVLPWIFYFPVTWLIVSLLLAEVLLFLAYSAPPLRLKDRGWMGMVADALYAHANPALIGAFTFYLLTNRQYEHFYLFLPALVGWQFFFGLRSILQHQIDDVANDLAAGSKTYVTRVGEKAARRLMKIVLLPLEIPAFLFYTWVVSLSFPAFFVFWPLYVALVALTRHRPTAYLFIDTYDLRWLPVIMLLYLCIRDPGMSLMLPIHLILFNKGLLKSLFKWRQSKKEKPIF